MVVDSLIRRTGDLSSMALAHGDRLNEATDQVGAKLKDQLDKHLVAVRETAGELESRSTALEQSMQAANTRLQDMAQQAASSLHNLMRGQSDEFLNAAEQIGNRIKELQFATVAQRDELIAAAKQAGAYLESALKLQAQEIAATAAGLVQQTHGLSASAKVQAELTGQGLADIVASFEEAAQRQAGPL